jgi:hypothetical protein
VPQGIASIESPGHHVGSSPWAVCACRAFHHDRLVGARLVQRNTNIVGQVNMEDFHSVRLFLQSAV